MQTTINISLNKVSGSKFSRDVDILAIEEPLEIMLEVVDVFQLLEKYSLFLD